MNCYYNDQYEQQINFHDDQNICLEESFKGRSCIPKKISQDLRPNLDLEYSFFGHSEQEHSFGICVNLELNRYYEADDKLHESRSFRKSFNIKSDVVLDESKRKKPFLKNQKEVGNNQISSLEHSFGVCVNHELSRYYEADDELQESISFRKSFNIKSDVVLDEGKCQIQNKVKSKKNWVYPYRYCQLSSSINLKEEKKFIESYVNESEKSFKNQEGVASLSSIDIYFSQSFITNSLFDQEDLDLEIEIESENTKTDKNTKTPSFLRVSLGNFSTPEIEHNPRIEHNAHDLTFGLGFPNQLIVYSNFTNVSNLRKAKESPKDQEEEKKSQNEREEENKSSNLQKKKNKENKKKIEKQRENVNIYQNYIRFLTKFLWDFICLISESKSKKQKQKVLTSLKNKIKKILDLPKYSPNDYTLVAWLEALLQDDSNILELIKNSSNYRFCLDSFAQEDLNFIKTISKEDLDDVDKTINSLQDFNRKDKKQEKICEILKRLHKMLLPQNYNFDKSFENLYAPYIFHFFSSGQMDPKNKIDFLRKSTTEKIYEKFKDIKMYREHEVDKYVMEKREDSRNCAELPHNNSKNLEVNSNYQKAIYFKDYISDNITRDKLSTQEYSCSDTPDQSTFKRPLEIPSNYSDGDETSKKVKTT